MRGNLERAAEHIVGDDIDDQPTRSPQYRRMPDDAAATAHQLFAVLRAFDAAGVKLIWIEAPPDTPEWEGVRDRLRRAAA